MSSLQTEGIITRIERKHKHRLRRYDEKKEARNVKKRLNALNGLPADYLLTGEKFPTRDFIEKVLSSN